VSVPLPWYGSSAPTSSIVYPVLELRRLLHVAVEEIVGINMTDQKNSDSNSINTLEPDSPCIGYCSTSFGADECAGCGRTAKEVVEWIALSDHEKKVIWERIRREARGIRFLRERQSLSKKSH